MIGCSNEPPSHAEDTSLADGFAADVDDVLDTADAADVPDVPETPEPSTLCLPCVEDADCGLAPCLEYGGTGRFCGEACSVEAPCPSGFNCSSGQCRSTTGICNCTPLALETRASTVCSRSNEAGACLGERTCEADGLTECTAAEPAADLCDGLDNDCDGDTDDIACDDNKACTTDSCTQAGCAFEPLIGQACDDGDSCTAAVGECDAAGQCVAAEIDCDDGDPCTADTCVPVQGCVSVDTMLCTCQVDDDCPPPEDRCLGLVKCVLTDEKPWLHCVQDPTSAVVCALAPDADPVCQEAVCIPSTGECEYPAINEGGPCESGAACQTDPVCTAGVCLGTPIVCTDGDDCNGVELCDPATNECVDLPPALGCPLAAHAGPDVAVDPGQTVVLTGSATGGDGVYTYTWAAADEENIEGQSATLMPEITKTWTLIVEDGSGESAEDQVTVQVIGVPLSLCEWPTIAFDPDGHTQPLAQWVFDEACTQSTQVKNAKPSILLSDLDFEQGSLTGAFHVDTTADDDLIGFVFGYQDKGDFYLMDWKQGGQDFCTADVFEGVSLKRIQAGGEALVCTDFFESLGTSKTTVLVKAIPPGWKDFVTYQWTLTIDAEKVVTITIAEGEKILHELSHPLPEFAGGKFGFYNNSQDSVVYELFQFLGP